MGPNLCSPLIYIYKFYNSSSIRGGGYYYVYVSSKPMSKFWVYLRDFGGTP